MNILIQSIESSVFIYSLAIFAIRLKD